MRKYILFAFSLLFCGLLSYAQDAVESREDRLKKHLYTLACDEMNGRAAGSEDAARARAYIVEQFGEIGLEPIYENGFEYSFTRSNTVYTDVVGFVRGNELAHEFIVVGAHYDHLGVKNGKVYNGADDNASGTAAMIEVARDLAATGGLKRSVIFAAFDAEELGLFGSQAFMESLNEAGLLGDVKLMMSIDMVGWYGKSGFLELEGSGTIKNGEALLRELASADDIKLKLKKFESSVFTATDTEAFAMAGIPTLAVTTGLRSPYHKPEDDPELIDYPGLDKVVAYVGDLSRYAASDEDFSASGKLAEKHSGKIKLFEAGVTLYAGGSDINLYESRMRSRGVFDYGMGLSAQFNFKAFAVRTDVIYTVHDCCLPDSKDLYGNKIRLKGSSLTIPLQFLLQTTSGPARGFIGAGPYYSRLFNWTASEDLGSGLNPNLYGVQAIAGFKLGHVALSVIPRWQLGRFFTNGNMPARMFSCEAGISYIF